MPPPLSLAGIFSLSHAYLMMSLNKIENEKQELKMFYSEKRKKFNFKLKKARMYQINVFFLLSMPKRGIERERKEEKYFCGANQAILWNSNSSKCSQCFQFIVDVIVCEISGIENGKEMKSSS